MTNDLHSPDIESRLNGQGPRTRWWRVGQAIVAAVAFSVGLPAGWLAMFSATEFPRYPLIPVSGLVLLLVIAIGLRRRRMLLALVVGLILGSGGAIALLCLGGAALQDF